VGEIGSCVHVRGCNNGDAFGEELASGRRTQLISADLNDLSTSLQSDLCSVKYSPSLTMIIGQFERILVLLSWKEGCY
jgi:hypothetical protein